MSVEVPSKRRKIAVTLLMFCLGVGLSLQLACGGATGTKKLINQIEKDTKPPVFSGIKDDPDDPDDFKVTSDGNQGYDITISWDQASDNVTPAAGIRYEICFAAYNKCTSSFISKRTVIGVTSTVINFSYTGPGDGDPGNKTYYFVVRAVDQSGNTEENTKTLSIATDNIKPTFLGITSAEAKSGTSIKIGWSLASDNITPQNKIVYEICHAILDNFTATCETVFNVTGSISNLAISYDVTGLDPNTTYKFIVRAKDAQSNISDNTLTTNPSGLTATTEDSLPPEFPVTVGSQLATTTSGLSGSDQKTKIKLTWNAATDNKTPQNQIVYNLYHFTTSPLPVNFSAPQAVSAAGATEHIITGLFPNTTYYFMVRACDEENNESGYYDHTDPEVVNIASATTAKETDRPTFDPDFVSIAALSSSSIQLTWSPGEDTGPAAEKTLQDDLVYHVYESTASISDTTDVTCPNTNEAVKCYVTNPGTTSHLSTGLTSGVTYHYWVRVKDRSDNLDITGISPKSEQTLDGVPPVFGGANSATVNGGNPFTKINVSWLDSYNNNLSDNVTLPANMHFDIYMKQGSGDCSDEGTILNNLVGTVQGVSSITIENLTPATQYTFVVRARDLQNNRETNCVQVTATTSTDNIAPTFAGATSTSDASSGSLRINWTLGSDNITPANGIQYWVCVSEVNNDCVTNFNAITDISNPDSVYPHVAQVNNYYVMTGLEPNTTYYFVVRAKDLAGNFETNTVQVSGTTLP